MFKFLKNKLNPAGRSLNVGKNFSVPLEPYANTGERDAILASSGMGKSYLTGVILEQTLESGCLVCVIDPEGEHYTLAERYPMIIIGGEHGSLPLEEDVLDLYIEAMLQHRLSAVFDLSEFLDVEQQHLYAVIAEHLFNLEQRYRTKVRLVIEEAQIYAPQRGTGAKKTKKMKDPVQASQKIAKRGRKRAIDSLWATQRPASLNKDILSQCNRFWFGGITSEQDYKAIKPFLNEAGITFANVKALKPGEFYFFGKGQTQLIQVRKRLCKHGGATPDAKDAHFQAAENKSLEQALQQLSELVMQRTVQRREEESEITKLKEVINELEHENNKLNKELEQEQMATKVIERLGSSKPGAPLTGGRKRKSAYEMMDEKGITVDETEPRVGGEKIELPGEVVAAQNITQNSADIAQQLEAAISEIKSAQTLSGQYEPDFKTGT